jgi:hypothetical protein
MSVEYMLKQVGMWALFLVVAVLLLWAYERVKVSRAKKKAELERRGRPPVTGTASAGPGSSPPRSGIAGKTEAGALPPHRQIDPPP